MAAHSWPSPPSSAASRNTMSTTDNTEASSPATTADGNGEQTDVSQTKQSGQAGERDTLQAQMGHGRPLSMIESVGSAANADSDYEGDDSLDKSFEVS